MPIRVQQFLAGVQRSVLPAGPNIQEIQDLFGAVVPTIDVGKQANIIEMGFHTMTMSVTATPYFTFVSQSIDDISRYHHLALATSNSTKKEWTVDIEYPEMPSNIGVGVMEMAELVAPLLPTGRTASVDMLHRQVADDGNAHRASFVARPFDVLPRGVLRVHRVSDEVGGIILSLLFVREIIATYNQVNHITGAIVGAEL